MFEFLRGAPPEIMVASVHNFIRTLNGSGDLSPRSPLDAPAKSFVRRILGEIEEAEGVSFDALAPPDKSRYANILWGIVRNELAPSDPSTSATQQLLTGFRRSYPIHASASRASDKKRPTSKRISLIADDIGVLTEESTGYGAGQRIEPLGYKAIRVVKPALESRDIDETVSVPGGQKKRIVRIVTEGGKSVVGVFLPFRKGDARFPAQRMPLVVKQLDEDNTDPELLPDPEHDIYTD